MSKNGPGFPPGCFLIQPPWRISIDVEAYKRLGELRRKDETFSQVIKRVVPVPFDFDAWLKSMARDPFTDFFVEAVEQRVATRHPRR